LPDIGRTAARLVSYWPVVLSAALILVYGLVKGDPASLALGVNITVLAIAAVGLTLTIGTAGQLALGQAGFMAIGAYGTAWLMKDRGWPFLGALVASLVATVVVGALVGYIALRLKGNYLAMATLAVGGAIYALLVVPSFLGGANGYAPIPPPSLFGELIIQPAGQYYLVAGALIVVLVVSKWLLDARPGRELVAIRDDEVAARTVGINVTRRKVQVFAITSLFGGLAGALNAPIQTAIDPTLFSPTVSLQLFVMVIIGGLGSIYGAVIGAAVVTWLITTVSANGSWALTILGAIVVVCMAVLPDGLAGIARLVRSVLPGPRRGRPPGDDSVLKPSDRAPEGVTA
jgi:branched-chain amino acid transport system permease protein